MKTDRTNYLPSINSNLIRVGLSVFYYGKDKYCRTIRVCGVITDKYHNIIEVTWKHATHIIRCNISEFENTQVLQKNLIKKPGRLYD